MTDIPKYLQDAGLKPSQFRRVQQLRNTLLTHFTETHSLRDTEVKRAAVKKTDYGTVWFTYEMGYVNDAGSTLSILAREFWYIEIGPKGAAVAHVCPKCFHQFKGTRLVSLWPLRIARDAC